MTYGEHVAPSLLAQENHHARNAGSQGHRAFPEGTAGSWAGGKRLKLQPEAWLRSGPEGLWEAETRWALCPFPPGPPSPTVTPPNLQQGPEGPGPYLSGRPELTQLLEISIVERALDLESTVSLTYHGTLNASLLSGPQFSHCSKHRPAHWSLSVRRCLPPSRKNKHCILSFPKSSGFPSKELSIILKSCPPSSYIFGIKKCHFFFLNEIRASNGMLARQGLFIRVSF